MEVAQGRNKFMTSTFTPFLIYLRYKNSVIWPVCFPNKHFYLQQIKSRPTSCGTGTSHSPSGDPEHRPEPSAASHKHGWGERAAEVEGKTPPHSFLTKFCREAALSLLIMSPNFTQTPSLIVPAKWLLDSHGPRFVSPPQGGTTPESRVTSYYFHETLPNKYFLSPHFTLLKGVCRRFSDSQNNRKTVDKKKKSLNFPRHLLSHDGDFYVLQEPRIPLVQFTSRPWFSINFLNATFSLGGSCALLEGNCEGKKLFASR